MNKKYTKEEIKKLFSTYRHRRIVEKNEDIEFEDTEAQKYWEYFLAGFNKANELNYRIGEGFIAIRYSPYESNQWGICDKQFFIKNNRTPMTFSKLNIPGFYEIGHHVFRHKDMTDGKIELIKLGFEIIDHPNYLLKLLILSGLKKEV